jgi:hypothetical protein
MTVVVGVLPLTIKLAYTLLEVTVEVMIMMVARLKS